MLLYETYILSPRVWCAGAVCCACGVGGSRHGAEGAGRSSGAIWHNADRKGVRRGGNGGKLFGKVASFKLARALGQDAIQILASDAQGTKGEGPATKMANDQKEEEEGARGGGRALFTGRSRDWRRGE